MRFANLARIAVAAAVSLHAQERPEFEVASVKANHSTHNGIGNHFEPQRMTWTNAPLHSLIEFAFGVRPYEVTGGPGWIDVDRWDIAATTSVPASREQQRAMMQTL